MKSAARMAKYRSYHNAVSKEFMDSIGFDTSADPIYADIAFRLPAPAATGSSNETSRPLTVGVGVMAYYGWRGDTGREPTSTQATSKSSRTSCSGFSIADITCASSWAR